MVKVVRWNRAGRMVQCDDAAVLEHSVEAMTGPALAFELSVRKGERSSERVRIYLDRDDLRALLLEVDKIGRHKPCEACGDRGWLRVAVDGDESRLEIQRCDMCERYASDADARLVAGCSS